MLNRLVTVSMKDGWEMCIIPSSLFLLIRMSSNRFDSPRSWIWKLPLMSLTMCSMDSMESAASGPSANCSGHPPQAVRDAWRGLGPPGEALEGGEGDSERARGLVKASSRAWVCNWWHHGPDQREWSRSGSGNWRKWRGSRDRREQRGRGKRDITCICRVEMKIFLALTFWKSEEIGRKTEMTYAKIF